MTKQTVGCLTLLMAVVTGMPALAGASDGPALAALRESASLSKTAAAAPGFERMSAAAQQGASAFTGEMPRRRPTVASAGPGPKKPGRAGAVASAPRPHRHEAMYASREPDFTDKHPVLYGIGMTVLLAAFFIGGGAIALAGLKMAETGAILGTIAFVSFMMTEGWNRWPPRFPWQDD